MMILIPTSKMFLFIGFMFFCDDGAGETNKFVGENRWSLGMLVLGRSCKSWFRFVGRSECSFFTMSWQQIK